MPIEPHQPLQPSGAPLQGHHQQPPRPQPHSPPPLPPLLSREDRKKVENEAKVRSAVRSVRCSSEQTINPAMNPVGDLESAAATVVANTNRRPVIAAPESAVSQHIPVGVQPFPSAAGAPLVRSPADQSVIMTKPVVTEAAQSVAAQGHSPLQGLPQTPQTGASRGNSSSQSPTGIEPPSSHCAHCPSRSHALFPLCALSLSGLVKLTVLSPHCAHFAVYFRHCHHALFIGHDDLNCLAPLVHLYHCSITALSLLYHCSITALSLLYHCPVWLLIDAVQ